MKTSLTILSAAMFSQLALVSCGADAPAPFDGTNSAVTTGDSTVPAPSTPMPTQGMVLPSPTPMPMATPPAVVDGPSPTPTPVTMPPPAATPTGPSPVPPMGTPTTLMPPTTPPVSTPAPATTPAPTPTPTPTMTPTAMPMPTAVVPASGAGNALVPDAMGWIDSTTNGVGVKGAWYEYSDAATTGLAMTVTGGQVCLTGTTAQQVDAGVEWGAGMGLVLNDGGAMVQNPWNGAAYTGFSFDVTLEMSLVGAPATIELKMGTVAPPHEKTITAGANTVLWTGVAQPSWATTMTAFSAAMLTAIQFKIGTMTTGTNTFTLCVSNLTVL